MFDQYVLLREAVAGRVGISISDLECLNLIVSSGNVALTAGQLALVTGLTSGGITGLVNRLQRAGFVRREADLIDRRKVRVVPVADSIAKLGVYYAPLEQRTDAIWNQYTEQQLKTILDFAQRSVAITSEETARVRALPVSRRKDPVIRSVLARRRFTA